MPAAKRHHYLPQFYLEGFTTNGLLFVFDRKKREFRRQTPVNTAVESGFYTLTDKDGNKHDDVETLLALIEGYVKPLLDKLVAVTDISVDERDVMSTFIAILYLRTPAFRRKHDGLREALMKRITQMTFANPEFAGAQMERMKATGKDVFAGRSPEQVSAMMSDTDEYTIKFPQEQSIQSMMELVPKLSPLFAAMDWYVVDAPERKNFVTCDEPFLLMPPKDYKPGLRGIGLATPGATKLVPLTKRACLMMTDPKANPTCRRFGAPDEWVRSVNLNVTENCERFVIGPVEALVKSLVKATGVDKSEPRQRFEVG